MIHFPRLIKKAARKARERDGRQSQAQRTFERAVREADAVYALARDLDQAIGILKIWGVLRGSRETSLRRAA